MMKTRHWLLLFLLLAGALRFWGLGDKSLWVDELKAVSVSGSFERIIHYCKGATTPPFRYFLLYYLIRFEPVESFVRLPGAVCGVASVLLMFLFVRRLFGLRVAAIAAGFFTFSPWQVLNSQDARMYTVFLMLVILSLMLTFLCIERKQMGYWVLLGLTMALGSYFSYFALWTSFIITVFLAILILIEARRSGWRARGGARLLLKGMVVCLFSAGVAYSPWACNLRYLLGRYRVAVPSERSASDASDASGEEAPVLAQEESTTQAAIRKALQSAVPPAYQTRFDREYVLSFAREMSCQNTAIALLVAGFAVLGLARLFRSNWRFSLLALLWFVVPVIILSLSSVRGFAPPRYLMYYHIVFVILAAIGLIFAAELAARLIQRAARLANRREGGGQTFGTLPAAGSFLLAVTIVAFYCRDLTSYYRQEKQDWRGAVNYLESAVKDGDVVLTGRTWSDLGLSRYWKDHSKRVKVVTPNFKSKEPLSVLSGSENLWYLGWWPMPEDVTALIEMHMKLERVFPGMYGDIRIYRRTVR